MTKKHIQARQEKARELGRRDAANRCAFCRRAVDGGAIYDFATGKKYCNDACVADDDERTALMEARA